MLSPSCMLRDLQLTTAPAAHLIFLLPLAVSVDLRWPNARGADSVQSLVEVAEGRESAMGGRSSLWIMLLSLGGTFAMVLLIAKHARATIDTAQAEAQQGRDTGGGTGGGGGGGGGGSGGGAGSGGLELEMQHRAAEGVVGAAAV